MDAQKILLEKIKQYDFALKELNLYLDTHIIPIIFLLYHIIH